MAYDLALLLTTKGLLSKAGVLKRIHQYFALFSISLLFFFSFISIGHQIGYLGHGNTSQSKLFSTMI